MAHFINLTAAHLLKNKSSQSHIYTSEASACFYYNRQFFYKHVVRHNSYVKSFQRITCSAYKELSVPVWPTLSSCTSAAPSPAPSPLSTSDLFIVLTW